MQGMKRKDGALAVRVPIDVKKALETQAASLDLSMSEYLRQHLIALAREDDELELDIDKRVIPSAESFSITVGDFVKDTVRGIQKEMFLRGYREALSMRRDEK